MDNDILKDACNMVMLQIGELIGRLSNEFINSHEDIDWGGFVGMRNIQAHRYEHIADDIVWNAINEDIPLLKSYLEKLL